MAWAGVQGKRAGGQEAEQSSRVDSPADSPQTGRLVQLPGRIHTAGARRTAGAHPRTNRRWAGLQGPAAADRRSERPAAQAPWSRAEGGRCSAHPAGRRRPAAGGWPKLPCRPVAVAQPTGGAAAAHGALPAGRQARAVKASFPHRGGPHRARSGGARCPDAPGQRSAGPCARSKRARPLAPGGAMRPCHGCGIAAACRCPGRRRGGGGRAPAALSDAFRSPYAPPGPSNRERVLLRLARLNQDPSAVDQRSGAARQQHSGAAPDDPAAAPCRLPR
jgi:hypothetical protein